MIKITIEHTVYTTAKVQKNLLTKKTPTNVIEKNNSSYGSGTREEVKFIEEYAVADVEEKTSVKYTLLEQEIPKSREEQFNLAAVIKAINGL